MTYAIAQGVQVSLDGSTWYSLTDHGRQPIQITYTLIEQADRMANGTFRKYVVGRKFVIKASWKDIPTLDSYLVDYNPLLGDVPSNSKGGAWIKAFYEGNNFYPIWVRFIFAKDATVPSSVPLASSYQDSKTVGELSDGQVYNAFMTSFTYNITKRNPPSQYSQGFDFVDLDIEFTEV